MKLRNKKTVDIIESEYMMLVQITSNKGERNLLFEDLTQFNNEWEDYKPKEPLIKDEKIRKAVRAWAEATGTTSISYWGGELESEQNDSKIEFDGIAVVEFGDNYSIAELCGEEEE